MTTRRTPDTQAYELKSWLKRTYPQINVDNISSDSPVLRPSDDNPAYRKFLATRAPTAVLRRVERRPSFDPLPPMPTPSISKKPKEPISPPEILAAAEEQGLESGTSFSSFLNMAKDAVVGTVTAPIKALETITEPLGMGAARKFEQLKEAPWKMVASPVWDVADVVKAVRKDASLGEQFRQAREEYRARPTWQRMAFETQGTLPALGVSATGAKLALQGGARALGARAGLTAGLPQAMLRAGELGLTGAAKVATPFVAAEKAADFVIAVPFRGVGKLIRHLKQRNLLVDARPPAQLALPAGRRQLALGPGAPTARPMGGRTLQFPTGPGKDPVVEAILVSPDNPFGVRTLLRDTPKLRAELGFTKGPILGQAEIKGVITTPSFEGVGPVHILPGNASKKQITSAFKLSRQEQRSANLRAAMLRAKQAPGTPAARAVGDIAEEVIPTTAGPTGPVEFDLRGLPPTLRKSVIGTEPVTTGHRPFTRPVAQAEIAEATRLGVGRPPVFPSQEPTSFLRTAIPRRGAAVAGDVPLTPRISPAAAVGDVPPGMAGVPPRAPTPGGAAGMAADAGIPRKPPFVSLPRDMGGIAREEVADTANPILRQLARLVNPSSLQSPLGKVVVAYQRQMATIPERVNVMLGASYDAHASSLPILKRLKGSTDILPINLDGTWKQSKLAWQTVVESPTKYKHLVDEREWAVITDFHTALKEIEQMRVASGLATRVGPLGHVEFYVPHQVATIRGAVPKRPANPKWQRYYEHVEEGRANGIEWSNSPRDTLRLHAEMAYREVFEKQMTDLVAPFGVVPSKLVPQQFWNDVRGSQQALRKAQREFRSVETQIARLEKVGQETGRSPAQVVSRQLRADQTRLRNRVQMLKTEHDKFTVKYKAAKLVAEKPTDVLPGKLFGQNQPATINVARWRERFYPEKDVELLKDGIERFGRGQAGKGYRAAQTIGDEIRFLSSVGDAAMPLIQGQPVLAYNPIVWGRMVLRHFQALLDPGVQARMIREYLPEYNWLAEHGVPIGDPEFFAAIRPGEGISFESLFRTVPKGRPLQRFLRLAGRQVFGRFQTAYSTGLGQSRALLLRSMKPSWKGTDAELAQFLRNLTGGLDTRALGVAPSQRGIESMFLAFSPRLLRSTVALVSDALRAFVGHAARRPVTAAQNASLRTLATYIAGVTGIYITSGLALRKSWEEISEGLNPLNGKRFLSHQINGDWIGIGGQIRSLMQLMAAMTSTLAPGGKPLEDVYTMHQFDNPIISWYRSRGAVGTNVFGGVIEATTGKDALPYDQVDTKIDLAKHLGTSALPFAVQGLLEGDGLEASIAGFLGARASPESIYDERNALAVEKYGKDYRDLPTRRKLVVSNDPEIRERLREARTTPYEQKLDEVDDIRLRQELALIKDRTRTLAQKRWRYKGIQDEARRDKAQVHKVFDRFQDDPESTATNANERAVEEYYKAIADSVDDTGDLINSVLERKLRALRWTRVQQAYVDANTSIRTHPKGMDKIIPALDSLPPELFLDHDMIPPEETAE